MTVRVILKVDLVRDEGTRTIAVKNGKAMGAEDRDVHGTAEFMLARFDAG